MKNDKLTNEQVAPYGWVKVPQSRSLGGTCLRVGDDYYVPAKREPRVFEGTVAELQRLGLNGPIGWRMETRVRVIEILEEETQ